MVNADLASPTHNSIRNWGLKIKACAAERERQAIRKEPNV